MGYVSVLNEKNELDPEIGKRILEVLGVSMQ